MPFWPIKQTKPDGVAHISREAPKSSPAEAFSWKAFLKTVLQPTFFKQTPIRLTLVFISVYSIVALLIFGYVYMASSAETRAVSDAAVEARLDALADIFAESGEAGVSEKLNEDDITEWFFIKGLMNDQGEILGQNRRASLELKPEIISTILQKAKAKSEQEALSDPMAMPSMVASQSKHPTQLMMINERIKDIRGVDQVYRYRGRILSLSPGLYLFVAMDTSWADSGFNRGLTALWGGAVLVITLGLLAGMIINQEVSKSVQRLMQGLQKVQAGDIKARVTLTHSGDEFDALGQSLNQTLDQMEHTMGNLKYAGDAIAHDLRTPLSRLRAKLELSLIEVEKDSTKAEDALTKALEETDQLLRTFQTVFSISRLQAQGKAPDQVVFSAYDLAADMAELFELSAEDKGLEFTAELEKDLMVMGNRDFLAQALANLLDNAIKYTQTGGITFRLRKTSRSEIEFSVTDTGPGVPEADRHRIIERFVRLEQSRTKPGVGLGLSMVAAVALAHKGHLTIHEGPGVYKNQGPGLRTALVLPMSQT